MDATRIAVLEAALDTPFESQDIGDTTPRKYMHCLLLTLLDEGEGFSGKRPWGNSGWEGEMALPLIKSGALKGSISMHDPEFPECTYDREEYADTLAEMSEVLCQAFL